MNAAVAFPQAYAADLEPFDLRWTVTSGDVALDLTDVLSARAVVQRPDREVLVWELELEAGATADLLELSRLTPATDFLDAALRVIPGTYSMRVLLTTEDGEIPGPLVWLPVVGWQ